MPDGTTDGSADTTTDTGQNAGQAPPDTGTDQTDWKAEAEKWQGLARKHEDRAKANSSAAKELEQQRLQSMSDTERAVAEAKAAGMAEAMAKVGAQLVAAELRAAGAGRLDPKALEVLVQGVNTAAFLTEDGSVDTKSVATFIDGIAPPKQEDTTQQHQLIDLGQGARSNGNGTYGIGDDNALLRDVKAKLGIR